MEIIKEKIFWTEKVANKTFTVDTDSDVIVPDTKPDIKKILQVDAFAKMTSSEIQSDRVLVNGNVNFNIIYSADDGTDALHSIKTTTPFTDVVSLDGINPKMTGNFETDVSGVSFKIINGRKFSVKSSVDVWASIGEMISTEYVDNIVDECVQVKKSDISFLSNVADHTRKIIVNENIIIPQAENSIAEIIKVSPTVSEFSTKVISNKVILKGELKLNCAYTDAGENDIKIVNSAVPFTEILDVDGIKAEDLCNTRLVVTDNFYNCQEDSNGEIRGIETSTEIKVNIMAMREETLSTVNDCYSTTANLQTQTIVARLPEKICDIDYEETLKTQISINDNEPAISKVYDVFSKAYIEKAEKDGDKFIVYGTIDNYVLYITEEKDVPIYCVKNEIEFSKMFDCGTKTSPDGLVDIKVLNTSYAINDINNIDLRVNVKVDGIIWNNVDTQIIADVAEDSAPLENDIASVTVYFAQENDSLWDIAKKYYTTIDAIRKINEGLDNEIQKGMQILIPKFRI